LSSSDDIVTVKMKVWGAMADDVDELQPSWIVLYNGCTELSAGTLASCDVLLGQPLRAAVDSTRVDAGDGDVHDIALSIAMSGSAANRKEEAGFRGTLLGCTSNAPAPATAAATQHVADNNDCGNTTADLTK
jgi:hypothetical protein